jgi:anti-sigma factor RsiW
MWAENMFESCLEIRNYFSDYLDDLCTPEARKSIRYHLSFCDVCQEQLAQWQSIQEELRALPRQQVSPELALRLRVQVSDELKKKPLSAFWVLSLT